MERGPVYEHGGDLTALVGQAEALRAHIGKDVAVVSDSLTGLQHELGALTVRARSRKGDGDDDNSEMHDHPAVRPAEQDPPDSRTGLVRRRRS